VLPYQQIYAAVTENPRYLGTQAQVIKSQMLARRIVDALKLTSDPAKIDRVASGFVGSLDVSPVQDTQVVSVSYRSSDPVFAARAINLLADEYVKYSFDVKHDAETRARDFLQNEMVKLQRTLEQAEEN